MYLEYNLLDFYVVVIYFGSFGVFGLYKIFH